MNAPANATEIERWKVGDQAGAVQRYRARTGEPLMVASRTLREESDSSLVAGYDCKRCGVPGPGEGEVLRHLNADCIVELRRRIDKLEEMLSRPGVTITVE
jgi:hypothetical protein